MNKRDERGRRLHGVIDVSVSSSSESSITSSGCSSKKLEALVQITRASISRAHVKSSIAAPAPYIAVEGSETANNSEANVLLGSPSASSCDVDSKGN